MKRRKNVNILPTTYCILAVTVCAAVWETADKYVVLYLVFLPLTN